MKQKSCKDPGRKGSYALPKKDVNGVGKKELPKTPIKPNAPLKRATWATGKTG